MKVRKALSIVLVLALLVTTMMACDKNPNDSDKKSIVVTIFPQYDWVMQILGDKADNFDITWLIGSNADMHSYSPSMSDIAKIATADLFIYVGGHSDEWVDDALAQATNPDMVVINMVEELGDNIIMVEHDCDDDECTDDHDDDELTQEEHVWVSLRMAQELCKVIVSAIADLDPDNTATYNANATNYNLKLTALDAQYKAMANDAPNKTLVFADRFPFLYMCKDYGLNHYAAFSGCSAESEASFSVIVQLSRRINENELKYVMITETGKHDLAQTIIDQTKAKNQKILVLNGLKTVTTSDVENGVTYLSVMQSNLEVLREALS
ncbi:MAG: metal ABC transporter substrate-binding protein [Oscillospiraceae bacterium]|nr:metal ABC transporter substrate-binding protein [Oscillospiraceae bacterium]